MSLNFGQAVQQIAETNPDTVTVLYLSWLPRRLSRLALAAQTKGQRYITTEFRQMEFMPVVGVDATEPALESMRAGELLGTVLNDAVNQGTATFNLACVLASGGVPTAENTGYTIDGQYVWIPYVPVGPDDL